MKLTTTKDSELTYINAMVFGDTGIGKTTSLRTLPMKGTLLGITERGTLPLRMLDYKAMRLSTWQDVRTLAGYFLAPDKIEDEAIKAAVKECRVLVIDSLSVVSTMLCTHIVTVDRRRLMQERTKGKRDAPENIYEEQMSKEDYGLYGTRMLNLISTFCQLPVHVIFTCLAAWSEDQHGHSVVRTPKLAGRQATKDGPAHFDLVLHMEACETDNGEPGRQWRTFNDGRILAKDASGALDPFEETDWTKLFKKILKPQGAKA